MTCVCTVQSVVVYASETWAVKVEEEQRMERNENVMFRSASMAGRAFRMTT